ncbi:MAG: response regulator [Desulfobulbaceae bacterium]|nr:response regulator [Desulfobulbaceae bacterium]
MVKKILVVDNNQVILHLMGHILAEDEYEVRTAVDGLNALEVLTNYQPDVIFVDLVMPKINGEKLCRILRTMPEMDNVFIVILSAIAAEEKLDFTTFGANACIAKGPFKEMQAHVADVLNHAKNENPSERKSRSIVGMENIFEREITKELLSTKRHYEVALNHISDAFLELTREGKVVYANPAACRLLGLAEEKLLSASFVDFFSPDYQMQILSLLAGLEDNSLSVGEDTPVILNDKHVRLNLVGVVEEKHQFVVAIINDITRRKIIEMQIISHQQELERLVAERAQEITNINNRLKEEITRNEHLAVEIKTLQKALQEAGAEIESSQSGKA